MSEENKTTPAATEVEVINQLRKTIRSEINRNRPIGSDYEHYQVVKEIVQVLHKNSLSINEGYLVLNEAKRTIGNGKII